MNGPGSVAMAALGRENSVHYPELGLGASGGGTGSPENEPERKIIGGKARQCCGLKFQRSCQVEEAGDSLKREEGSLALRQGCL
jgi:hypothetical protein